MLVLSIPPNNLNDHVIILVLVLTSSWSHFIFDHMGIKPAGRRTVWAALLLKYLSVRIFVL
jgi:hypothetical protein